MMHAPSSIKGRSRPMATRGSAWMLATAEIVEAFAREQMPIAGDVALV